MVNRTLIIVLVIVVVLAIATFFFGGGLNFGEGVAPEVMMARQAQQAAGTAPPPAEVEEEVPSPVDVPAAEEEAVEPPAAEAEEPAAAEEEVAADEVAEPSAAEEEVEADEGAEPAEAEEAVDEEEAVEPEAGEEAAEAEEPGEEEAEAEAEAEEPAEEEAAAEAEEVAEAEEEAPGDPVANFKALDPRDIILKKYEDLDTRTTAPWDEENPETYIPNTGRVDPLTRVFGSVPDELKPPRAGETDMNEINTFLIADAATQIVNAVAASIECHNVIQIGLQKYATFSFNGQRFTLEEGQNTSGNVGNVNGIPITLTISCSAISTSEVTLNLVASGYGTPTRIEKNQVYIPRNNY